MTCGKCVETVKTALNKIKGIQKADVTLNPPHAVITMEAHIPTEVMNKHLAAAGNYSLQDTENTHLDTAGAAAHSAIQPEETRSFFEAYKPILLVFAFLLGLTLLSEITKSRFNVMTAMNTFMGGFFLIFSFFKLLDVKGFAYSYMSYDIIAKRWLGWGYIYPFVELALGLAYLFHFDHTITNITTIVVMGVSCIGVIQSLLAKRKIQCACLGTVFNLPMSKITLIEDSLMVLMAAAMLLL